MGKNNSSQCRVAPMMNWMLKNKSKLVEMLGLVKIAAKENELEDSNIYYDGHNGEKALKPPCKYLCDIIESLPDNQYARESIAKQDVAQATKDKRLELCDKNAGVKREAAKAIIRDKYAQLGKDSRQWYILEGSSKPDVFIETPACVIVVEGKWTEPGVTKSTMYVEKRNQLVRHIHCALNYIKVNKLDKQVYGFYIVPQATADKDKLDARSFNSMLDGQFGIQNCRQEIAAAYKGYLSWEQLIERYPEIKKESGWQDKAVHK